MRPAPAGRLPGVASAPEGCTIATGFGMQPTARGTAYRGCRSAGGGVHSVAFEAFR
jgi:hypothetical protein